MPRKSSALLRLPRPLPKQGSLSERIYLSLRTRLQRSEFGPDARLVDLELAAVYGTSRMPAREALLRLVNEGYLVGTTRGFTTPKLSLDDIRDIFEVRKLLEPQAAANAARDLGAAGRHRLTSVMNDVRLAGRDDDAGCLILANIDFRNVWLEALRNERLAATLARFVDQVQTVRLGTLRDAPTRRTVVAGLEKLYDAFMRGDSTAAAERMAAFVAAAERSFFDVRAATAPSVPLEKSA